MYNDILKILRTELKPALGCVGPIGTCFAAAQAYDAIGGEIKKITVKVDWDRAKNDDVAMPGTEYPGIEMSVAIGAVCGNPNAGLEVLRDVTPEGELKARKVAELVTVEPHFEFPQSGIYNEIIIETDKGVGRAICRGRGDGLVLKERNGEILFETEADASAQSGNTPLRKYKIKDLYDFAVNIPAEELDICKTAVDYNRELAKAAMENEVGIGIGKQLATMAKPDDITARAKAWAAAGCEARMAGVRLSAMSCANKGNVGIATSMPIMSVAQDIGASEEDLKRAVALSSLIAMSIIHRIGKTPSMCSCEVAAALGVSAGVVLLHKGTWEQVEIAMQNVIPSIFGVVCDGARLACALRLSTGTGVALEAANLALGGVRIPFNQGVLSTSIDESLNVIGETALYGMLESDKAICRQMFAKRKIFPLKTFAERQKQ